MKSYLIPVIVVLVAALSVGTAVCSAPEAGWNETGIRMGIQVGPKHEYFHLFNNGLSVGYRIAHLSNNRILYAYNTPNPGLDMHLVGISWKF